MADGLATLLGERGLTSGEPVVICVEPGPLTAVAILGVLKAGGAYVPVATSDPVERIAYVLTDAAARLLVTEERQLPRVGGLVPDPIVLDRLGDVEGAGARPSIDPQQTAYVLYTSGSSGRPKGVAVAHANLAYYLRWHLEHLRPATGDLDLPLSSSICFAAGVTQFYAPLLLGRTQHVFARDTMREPQRVFDWYAGHPDYGLYCVPTLWNELLKFAESAAASGRPVAGPRCVLLSGEAVGAQLVERSVGVWPELRMWNLYGPTETVANASAGELRSGRPPTIGAPIAGTRIHLVDEEMREVPAGEPGEICICGPGVATGYLNLPDMTSERFVTCPFDRNGGHRVFRTGDLGTRDDRGELTYVGRRDNQVKVRGHRVECGEIEEALQAHQAVRQAVVVARESADLERRLVAYVTFHVARYASVDELRAFLATSLPDFMIPAAFVTLDDLPQLANGKTDRRRLPAPGRSRPDLGYAVVAPRSVREGQLVRIWEASLRLEGLGATDDFFDLGGDSLKVADAISRIRETLRHSPSYRLFFDHPTPAALAAVLDGEQRAPVPARLERKPSANAYPCAENQRSLWLLTQTFPALPAYNMQLSLTFDGDLDEPALVAALADTVERHDALRVVIRRDGDRPVMAIRTPAGPLPDVVDLRSLDPRGRDAELERRCAGERDRPFDLEAGPLLRAALYRLSDDRHRLTVTVHHLVFDGRSLDVFFRHLVDRYRARRTGRPLPRSAADPQYQDWCVAQHERGDTSRDGALAAFWRDCLEGSPLVLELPTDHVRPAVRSFRGATSSVRVGSELRGAIAELARDAQATPFMALLAAFNVLLHRACGQEDILVGCPVANRQQPGAEDLVGFLANTIVLRTQLTLRQGFDDLLAATRDRCLSALEHQTMPFETLLDILRPERSLSQAPIFQVMFGYHDQPYRARVDERLVARASDDGTGGAKYDLVLDVLADDDGWELRLTYSTDLYRPKTIERWLDQYVRLLGAIAESPSRSVGEYELVGDADRERFERWNATEHANERRDGLHRLFECQAERTPGNIALVDGERSLSYAELDARSNRLARHLAGLGVSAGALVGVHVEASAEMVVAMLAVLKSGGAYVPLDPYYPPQRIADAVADSGVDVIVAHRHLTERLAAPGATVVAIDDDWPEIERHSPDPLPQGEAGRGLMYVMFTSGSTGRPKGVMVTHEGAANYVLWMRDTFPHAAGDRVLCKTSMNFDISVWEIFLPLVCGARLVVARRQECQAPEALAALIARERITTIQFVPSALRAFVDSGLLAGCDSLTRIFSGGEALPARLQDEVLGSCTAELHNVYGPTEASIYSTHHVCRHERLRSVPIGRPIHNTSIHILDERMRHVAIGTAGDLYIGGVGVAAGYLGQADLTAAAFVPDPFSGSDGARMFKTNDRARYFEDGAIEFLGRSDGQVKVRGYRVELGEIAHHLNAHPRVRHAIIIVREDEADDVRLVAYLLYEERSGPGEEELRSYLRQKLPDHMIPSAYVSLDSIPLLPNNKANVAALPKPEYTKTPRSDLRRAYSDERERALAEIWEDVLGTSRFGPEDSFFDVGGHSLLMARLGALIEERLSTPVSNLKLFQFPTIRSLARHLASQDRSVSGVAAEMARRSALRNGHRARARPATKEP